MKYLIMKVEKHLKKKVFCYQLNIEGYLLIEVIIYILIVTLVFSISLKMVNSVNIANLKLNEQIDQLNRVNDAFEQIIFEIKTSEKIIQLSENTNNQNIGFGFIIIKKGIEYRYNFIIYEYNRYNKTIYRRAYNSEILKIDLKKFSGNNIVIKNINSIDGTYFNIEQNYINLKMKFNYNNGEKTLVRKVKLYV